MSYEIVRNFSRGGKRTVVTRLTLEQAQTWCQDRESSSSTCTKPSNVGRTRVMGPWFEGLVEGARGATPPA